MKIGFYYGLAKDGIRKNRRMYIPYILTCIGMVMMNYLILFLQTDENVRILKGGGNIQTMLGFGSYVMGIFAAIFLFYTNSFLIRRRKKEFGLYNILGMGRRHIAIVIFFESILVALIALVAGMALGVLFSKFAELGLVNMVRESATYSFSIGAEAILKTIKIYAIIFGLLFLNNLRQLYFTSTIALLGSEKAGEKPPKAKWFLAATGVVILGIAYYISITITNPLAAFTLFFVAVIMVIVATYILMVSGSVAMCKILQKNKKYYYKKNHFVSVSSMAYRMNRNGEGLATICILATMVLVIVSSTSCLYFGADDSLNKRYPRQLEASFDIGSAEQISEASVEEYKANVDELLAKENVNVSNKSDNRYGYVAGSLDGNSLMADVNRLNSLGVDAMNKLISVYFIPIEDYNAATGENVQLAVGEALMYYSKGFEDDALVMDDTVTINVKAKTDNCPFIEDANSDIVPIMMLYVDNFDEYIEKLSAQLVGKDGSNISLNYSYAFDTDLSAKGQMKLSKKLSKELGKLYSTENYEGVVCEIGCREGERDDFFTSFGGLFYLGLLLSGVFIFAAVLIIYYKQISEGYEDQARFEIMRKVGMTDKEIKGSINSQMLTVFFFPLILAGIHVAFAFPIIRKLLLLFNLNNVGLFVETCVISFLIFGVIYAAVYKITSNAYYRIVRTNE